MACAHQHQASSWGGFKKIAQKILNSEVIVPPVPVTVLE